MPLSNTCSPWRVCFVLAFAWGAFAVGALPAQQASEQATLARIDRQLAVGEFGPAASAIDQLPDRNLRDRLFSRLATAQATAGARQGALATTSQIKDDQLYSNALQTLSPAEPAARGGGPQADFDSLIDLITTTIQPPSWEEVGGPGAIDSFEGGVYVDAAGLMRQVPRQISHELARLREAAAVPRALGDWHTSSEFRKISLPRLERAVMQAHAAGRDPSEEMQYLAGLHRVTHVLLYADTGDLVLAGPAGDYRLDAEGRPVSLDSGRPLLRLDDLVVVLRNALADQSRFGCSITPRQQQLAATKAYLAESGQQPLKPGGRQRWLSGLREKLGRQDITVYGIDPRTRAGRVMIEADYRMKLVGMGLEEGVLGVDSYLASIPQPADGEAPPGLDVLRWWFTLNYHALHTTKARNAFALRGKSVQVKSENEMLSDLGERGHTGQSDDLNLQFAHSFSQHIDQLATKYPIYAELQNVFDLAMASAVIVREDYPAQADWQPTHFAPEGEYQPALGTAPTEVETVINHRVLGKKHIVAGVSGGVRVDATSWFDQPDRYQLEEYGLLKAAHGNSTRSAELAREAWWWD